MKKSNAGRPTLMTEETVNKLEQAFAFGCSDLEACLYADISKQTLYNYQDKHPEFIDRKERLKETPVLMARESVIKGFKDDHNLALKYLERKVKNEFSLRTDITSDDKGLNGTNINILQITTDELLKITKGD